MIYSRTYQSQYKKQEGADENIDLFDKLYNQKEHSIKLESHEYFCMHYYSFITYLVSFSSDLSLLSHFETVFQYNQFHSLQNIDLSSIFLFFPSLSIRSIYWY